MFLVLGNVPNCNVYLDDVVKRMKVEKEKTVSVFRGRSVTVKACLSLFCGYWYLFFGPPVVLIWFILFSRG